MSNRISLFIFMLSTLLMGGVHTVQASHLRYARTRRHGFFHDPPLLLYRAPAAATLRTTADGFRIHYDALLHTAIVYLSIPGVQTVEAEHLRII